MSHTRDQIIDYQLLNLNSGLLSPLLTLYGVQCVLFLHVSFNPGGPNAIVFTSVEEISEANLLRDILFVFQGIEGKWMHYNQKEDAYRIDEKVLYLMLI